MPKVIEAVYENGVFKPLEKVNLKEGEKIRIKIQWNRRERRLRFLEDWKPVKPERDITVEDIEKLRLERYEGIP
ncbi:antitoxin family protein [Geoglobus sp.]